MKRYSDNKIEYLSRINKAIDYIENNLDKQIRINDIAEVSNFSPYHFHRIFGSVVGETLNSFIDRLRLEKAASSLLSKRNVSITQISVECGFSTLSSFTRAFKEKYGMSASDWRGGGYAVNNNKRKGISKKGKEDSKNGKEINSSVLNNEAIFAFRETFYTQNGRREKKSSVKPKIVKVEELPEMCLAYVRHIRPYKGDDFSFRNLFKKIISWAGPRGHLSDPEAKFLSVYHDNPEITETDKLRISVGLTVPFDTEVDGEIGKMTIPKGKYVLANFEIDQNQNQEAWDNVFGEWFPKSGYTCDDSPCFEWVLNDPDDHPEKKYLINICVPLKPL